MTTTWPPCLRLAGCWFAALALGCLAAGCGGSAPGHVSGKVLLQDGKPLPGGIVVFYPQEAGRERNPVSATIKPDGSYDALDVPAGPARIAVGNAMLDRRAGERLMSGMAAKSMSAIGPPKGALKGVEMPQAGGPRPAGTFIPLDPKYANPASSGLSYDVRPGDQEQNITGIVAIGPPQR